jgi:Spy/CpxP family protein refolding chaperone
MQRSKELALTFLLGAFLTGGALGFAADHVMSRNHHGMRGGRESMSARIASELNLTPAQKIAMDSLMERRRREIREVYKPIRPQLDSLEKVGRAISDSTHAEIRRILTPEQQVKWDAMRDRARKAYEASRKRMGDRPAPLPK